MKSKILSLALIGLTSLALAQEKGLRFENGLSWQQIRTKAKTENKFIFIDVFATWCWSCKAMDDSTYPAEKVGSFMNDKFISVKVQADQTSNDNEFIKTWYNDAKQIVKDYQITGFPTLLFFSPDGKLVNRFLGLMWEDALIKVATESLDPATQLYAQFQKYRDGKMKIAKKPEIAILAKSVGENKIAQEIADDYINNYLFKLGGERVLTEENLRFISRFLGSSHSKAFNFFEKESGKVNAILGYYQAEYAIMNFINQNHLPKEDTWAKETPDWDDLEKNITKMYGSLGREVVYSQRTAYYLATKNWNQYGIWYEKYLKDSYKHPRYDINSLSWSIFENVTDPEILQFACDTVMKYALEEWYQNEPAYWDTYANLLYKIGRNAEAIEWEAKAVKFSNNNKDIVENFNKMKNGIKTWPEAAAKL